MSNFKFRGFIPAVTKYVKSKPLVEVVAEVIAFGVLLPMVVLGITSLILGLITGEINTSNVSFGIYG